MTAMAEIQANKLPDVNALLGESKAGIHAPLPHHFVEFQQNTVDVIRHGEASMNLPALEKHVDRSFHPFEEKHEVLFGSAKAPQAEVGNVGGRTMAKAFGVEMAQEVGGEAGMRQEVRFDRQKLDDTVENLKAHNLYDKTQEFAKGLNDLEATYGKDRATYIKAVSDLANKLFPGTNPSEVPDIAYASLFTPGIALDKNKRRKLINVGVMMSVLLSACTQAVETAMPSTPDLPTPIVQITPGAISTETPIPYFPPTANVETAVPPTEIGSVTLPDYKNYSSEGFVKPISLSELKKAKESGQAPAGLTLAAVDAYIQNAESMINGLPTADKVNASALVCYRSDLQRNAVVVTRDSDGKRDVLWLFSANTPSYHPNFPSFSADNEGDLAYKWVRLGSGDVVCRYDGEFPVIATQVAATDARLASVFTPSEAKFVAAPTPTEAPTEVAGPKEGDTLVENGYTYTYTIIRSPDTKDTLYAGFFRPLANMPLDPWLAKYVPDGHGGYVEATDANDIGPTKLLIEKGVDGEQKIKAITQIKSERGVAYPHYESALETWMRKHYFDTTPGADDYKYSSALQDGGVTYTFHVGDKEYTWTISPRSGATIYVLKNDPAYLTPENGFWKWVDAPYGTEFATAFWGVDAHGLIGAISPSKSLDELDPKELRILPLFHETTVINNDQVQGVGYSQKLQALISFASEGTPPIIDIENQK